MGKLVAVVVAVTACGGSSGKPDALVLVDGTPIDSAPPLGPNSVTVGVFGGTPSLVSYRDGRGPWLTPDVDAMGDYVLHVTNDFQLVVVCTDSTGFESTLYNATSAEVSGLYMPCLKNISPPPATVAVTGQMTQPGTIEMYDRGSSTTGPWSFSLNVPTGTHDLVAYDASDILIRRSQTIAGATSIPAVDLTQGSALTPVQLTINNRVGGDTLETDLDLLLGHDAATLIGSSTTLMTPPSSLLLSNDLEFLFATVSTATTWRYVDTELPSSQTSFDLMPVLGGITYAQSGEVASASWGTLPPFHEIAMSVNHSSSSTAFSFAQVSATQGWLSATGADHLAFDAMPPGYDPAWKIDLSGPYVRDFSAFGGSGGISYGTSLREGVNGATPRVRPEMNRVRYAPLRPRSLRR